MGSRRSSAKRWCFDVQLLVNWRFSVCRCPFAVYSKWTKCPRALNHLIRVQTNLFPSQTPARPCQTTFSGSLFSDNTDISILLPALVKSQNGQDCVGISNMPLSGCGLPPPPPEPNKCTRNCARTSGPVVERVNGGDIQSIDTDH